MSYQQSGATSSSWYTRQDQLLFPLFTNLSSSHETGRCFAKGDWCPHCIQFTGSHEQPCQTIPCRCWRSFSSSGCLDGKRIEIDGYQGAFGSMRCRKVGWGRVIVSLWVAGNHCAETNPFQFLIFIDQPCWRNTCKWLFGYWKKEW